MPLKNQLHVDQLLSNISVQYKNSEYIADKVFPIVPVVHDSDKYRVFNRDFKLPETQRNPKSVAKEYSFEVSYSSYLLKDHALKEYVSDDDADNYDIADLRADTTEFLTDKILLRREKTVADLFVKANWSLNVSLAATNCWSLNGTTVSSPILFFDTGTTTVIRNSGMKPNFGIIPRLGYVSAKNHTEVLERVKYTTTEVGEKLLAALLGVDELLVPTASIDTAALGIAESMGDVWGDNAFLGYKPANASPLKPSSGYIFEKKIPRVRRWREEERKSEAVEVQMKFDPRVVASLSGYLILDLNQ